MEEIIFVSFQKEDENLLRNLIKAVGWNDNQIEGQILSIKNLSTQPDGYVLMAKQGGYILGYITAQVYAWNKLGQIHGLVVNPNSRRQNIATRLIEKAEKFLTEKSARGVYVDTPVDNQGGRNFYEAVGYKLAYIMPEYYDKGKDGVTYIKFF